MKKNWLTPTFLVGCFCVGYFGLQMFEWEILVCIGGGLFVFGAFVFVIEFLESKTVTKRYPIKK